MISGLQPRDRLGKGGSQNDKVSTTVWEGSENTGKKRNKER